MSMKCSWLVTFLLITSLKTALGVSASPAPADYRFAPGDVIDVSVTPQKGYDRAITVQPDGKISYPLAGQLQAAGLSVEELAQKLHDGLKRELRDPLVTLSLKELNKQAVRRVSLLGAVRNPGVFEIKDGTGLAEILASGG